MTHEEARDAMALFVVDADDAPTRQALREHLDGCPECRTELAELTLAADALARVVPQVTPRAELRARTLGAVMGTARPPADARPPQPSHEVAGRAEPAPPTATRSGGRTRWLPLAAAVVAAVSAAGWWQTRAEVAALRATLATWEARVVEAERRAAESQRTLVQYEQRQELLTADDVQLVSLDGVPPAATARGRAFVSAARRAILFTARDLPPLPEGRTYQLWAIAGGQAISAGIFVPDGLGSTQVVAAVPALTDRAEAVAVTVEPAGGVPAPTGPKYLIGAATE